MTTVKSEEGLDHSAGAAPKDSQPVLRVENLQKFFTRRDKTKVPAVDGIDLEVAPGEFLVLLGPSGCGKTTLLRCIAGLEQPDSGAITINGDVQYSSEARKSTTPDQRNLGMVFQSYALWPHMKVFANVAYPLKLRKVPRVEIRDRVMHVLELVGIEELAEQFPGQLSGGQQQRVALARALVSNNGLVLFDEPLSNVDAKVREQLRYEILRMQEEIGFAAIYVTHDQQEAMELADRVAVLHSGRIAQLARPEAIYDTPADHYVAKFVGAANEVHGKVSSNDGQRIVVQTEAGGVIGVPGEAGLAIGDEVSVIGRPERFVIGLTAAPAGENEWRGELVTTMFMGDQRGVVVRLPGWGDTRVHFQSTESIGLDVESLVVSIDPKSARVYRAPQS